MEETFEKALKKEGFKEPFCTLYGIPIYVDHSISEDKYYLVVGGKTCRNIMGKIPLRVLSEFLKPEKMKED